MAKLAISKDYFPAYARLPRKAQRKADEFLRKFEQDSTSLGIHLEPLHGAVDRQLRSARIGDDYRMILRAPERGDMFLVLWADHHDEAYRWAETKQTAVHPATGSLQIFDVIGATESLTTGLDEERIGTSRIATAVEETEPAGLFEQHADGQLFLAGVPHALIPSVRALVNDADLDRLLPHLPPEAGEVLTALAAGLSLDEALEEILGRVTITAGETAPTAIDVQDVAAALTRETTQRQFRALGEDLDLDSALKFPLDVWRVFLHPRQRQIARARTKGPTRVLGGAGTGKTVVALHRAAFLVREVFSKPDDRVLFTTFTVNLAHDLRTQLAKLLEPDALARVEVINIDAWATGYLRGRGRPVRPAYEDDQDEHLKAAYEVYGVDDVPLSFYRAELREVIQDQGLRTEESYVQAVRKYRGTPLGRAERRRLWPVFAAYRDILEEAGLMEPLDIFRLARNELELETGAPRYRALVVDEVQDFSADALRLLRAIAGPERPDDLFLVGDAHQRIYGRAVALSPCGIQVRGRRSQTLRINYRTTGPICRWSIAILKNAPIDDLDGGDADRRGYVSLREGPPPNVHPSATGLDEEATAVATVRKYLDAGTPAEAICLVARTKVPLRGRFGPAFERAGIGAIMLEREEPRMPGVRMATMHRVKGLEFSVVVLVGIGKVEVPFPSPELKSDDPLLREHAVLRERSLLYVAASRARDAVHVLYHGEPSPLLPPALRDGARAVTPVPRPKRGSVRPALDVQFDSTPTKQGPSLDTEGLGKVLATPLGEYELPTRLRNWAEREGIGTLGTLAGYAPTTLMTQPNLGRTSVRHARRIIEEATGQRWESVRSIAAKLPETTVDQAAPAATGEASSWDGVRSRLSAEQRQLLLDGIPLPARIKSFVAREKLLTLGDLAKLSRADLQDQPSVGRASIAALPGDVSKYLAAVANAAARVEEGLLECFKVAVDELEPTQRIIATRRSGLGSDSLTLQELGDMFGVSRERIRQLESKLCEQLRRQPWSTEARRRISAATHDGAVPLEVLASDVWWTAAVACPSVVAFMIEHVLELDIRVIEFHELAWLSKHKAGVLADAFSALVAQAKATPLPTPLATFAPMVPQSAAPFGPHVASHFFDELKGQMTLEDSLEPDTQQVLAIGDTRNAEVLAILRAAQEPVHVEELFRRMGRRMGAFPDEVLYFRRGYVGLRKHFPDFDTWQAKLVPAALRLVRELGPDRQWYCGELLEELREDHDIPEWLTAFGLAALIKASGSLRYLGRLRVALLGSKETERRVYVHEGLEQLLLEAGEPVSRSDLMLKLSERLGMSEYGAIVFNRPQFVSVDADRIGLLARDVPGGAAAISEASAHLDAALVRRGRGMSEFHAHQEIVGLSKDHALWSRHLTMSILRSDGRFRLSQSGAVGLATWESTMVPTRLELLRSALEEAGGRVSTEAVFARIEAHYGERPLRSSLISIAMNVGAGVDGEWVVRKATPSA